jgi:pimeloyl-ACP methyl ester carboxylesterase
MSNPKNFTGRQVVQRANLASIWMAVLAATLAGTPAAQAQTQGMDPSCQLRYPIVLSHHWSARLICPDATVTGARACVNTEDYARLCAVKGVDAQGQRTCAEWRVPAEDANLPPRDHNLVDPTLSRSMQAYHRYFSRAIVDGLAKACGNAVYVADKPPYASYEARARSLRHTVLQALAETGAAKVILIGMSQGAQDARFLTAALPVSDTDPAQGRMQDKVAAVVTLSGEDGGAESATLQLDLARLNNGGNWADFSRASGELDLQAISQQYWTRSVNGQTQYVLSEDCPAGSGGPACAADTLAQRYAWFLRSVVELTPHYMKPDWLQTASNIGRDWRALKAAAGMTHDSWLAQVPRASETRNGVRYLSYAASLRSYSALLGTPEVFYALLLTAGPNDAYVSVAHQKLSNPAANFEHVKTLNGSVFGRGYHHMFFSGRNDALYAPGSAWREPAPYDGDSASFYRQVARDLQSRGF